MGKAVAFVIAVLAFCWVVTHENGVATAVGFAVTVAVMAEGLVRRST